MPGLDLETQGSSPCNLCVEKPSNGSTLMTFIFNDMYVCASVYEYVHVCVGARAGQKTVHVPWN